jgi:hypothetical protein
VKDVNDMTLDQLLKSPKFQEKCRELSLTHVHDVVPKDADYQVYLWLNGTLDALSWAGWKVVKK